MQGIPRFQSAPLHPVNMVTMALRRHGYIRSQKFACFFTLYGLERRYQWQALIISAVSPILVTPCEDPTDTVRKVKDFKRKIPGNGRPYFARRCLTEEGRAQYKTHWPMEILFNYLGQYQVCTLDILSQSHTDS
jgi:hypothetical protein